MKRLPSRRWISFSFPDCFSFPGTSARTKTARSNDQSNFTTSSQGVGVEFEIESLEHVAVALLVLLPETALDVDLGHDPRQFPPLLIPALKTPPSHHLVLQIALQILSLRRPASAMGRWIIGVVVVW